ncbi:MAG: class I SAM-dependent methyltransferase, partial [Alphaproteobacteria bacterium]|nr:class I SAM-dependent methyltransferase [Alphaproteobacteria bacterium]
MSLASSPADARGNFALPLFVTTIFTSAALLFSVQPMFAKMVLPQLGGSPGVWSVAMVVFQTLLLAGYAYAHALIRWLPGTPGLALHLVVTLVAAFSLPFAIRMAGPPPADAGMFYVIGIFLTAIGPSFFALSANGPLLQAWFVHTGHRTAHDPYFIYAASNIGSFLALFAYPFVMEPLLTLGQQRLYWTVGYWTLLILLALCAFLVAPRWPKALPAHAQRDETPAEAITMRRALGWIGLSAVPSGLLVAVTAQISTDIASAPMLWVMPLALYLFTFVIVFQPRPWIPH